LRLAFWYSSTFSAGFFAFSVAIEPASQAFKTTYW